VGVTIGKDVIAKLTTDKIENRNSLALNPDSPADTFTPTLILREAQGS